jgi:hypothetical protein
MMTLSLDLSGRTHEKALTGDAPLLNTSSKGGATENEEMGFSFAVWCGP